MYVEVHCGKCKMPGLCDDDAVVDDDDDDDDDDCTYCIYTVYIQ